MTEKREFKLEIFWTNRYKRFGVMELYKAPRDIDEEAMIRLRIHGLEFLLVFSEGEKGRVYKSEYSSVNLAPLAKLLGGSARDYGFDFDPQQEIPLAVLIEKIQELL